MADFTTLFAIALVICAIATFLSSDIYKKMSGKVSTGDEEGITPEITAKHNNLLKKYLFIYLLATLSDWLQGPYVYALYMDYGFEQHEIAQLFVAGFGSSMIFGSFVGGMADWGGRRNFVVIFALVYAASCITKHFKDYNVLMLGRLLGGVSTSLLFSVFEAWLIRAHSDADLPKSLLSKSFSWAAFGNSLVAISAGLVANKIAHSGPMTPVTDKIHVGGFLNPFDLALCALAVCAIGAQVLWDENYGEKEVHGEKESEGKGQAHWYSGLKDAATTTFRNWDIMLCGIISSLFEGSMYIFVFMWTPLLKSFIPEGSKDELPFGLIFSTFMVCCMTGSSIFSIMVEKFPVEKLGIVIFGVGAAAMALVAAEINETMSFVGMNLFEVCVGLYFPIMGTMKGGIVPESKRAAIYNIFRVPLNFIVLFSLLTDLEPSVSFTLNAIMLGTATFLQVVLAKRRQDNMGTTSEAAPLVASEDIESN